MSLKHIEQQVYDAAKAGNAEVISSLLAANPSGTVDLSKRNPNAVGCSVASDLNCRELPVVLAVRIPWIL